MLQRRRKVGPKSAKKQPFPVPTNIFLLSFSPHRVFSPHRHLSPTPIDGGAAPLRT